MLFVLHWLLCVHGLNPRSLSLPFRWWSGLPVVQFLGSMGTDLTEHSNFCMCLACIPACVWFTAQCLFVSTRRFEKLWQIWLSVVLLYCLHIWPMMYKRNTSTMRNGDFWIHSIMIYTADLKLRYSLCCVFSVVLLYCLHIWPMMTTGRAHSLMRNGTHLGNTIKIRLLTVCLSSSTS